MKSLGLLLLSLTLSSCSLLGSASELEQARGVWESAGVTDYSMTLTRSCFCPPSSSGPFDVEVRGGAIASVRYQGEPVEARLALTVDDLFDLLADAERRGAETITAAYDVRLGFPQSVYIDYDAQIADEEIGYTVSGLTRL